jgi:GNAT superfamily N-acetyltransferase
MVGEPSGADARDVTFRAATEGDVDLLTAVERAAGLAMLGHVFAPERYPYPTAEVAARWRRVLTATHLSCLVAIRAEDVVALVAWGGQTVEHLAVHPAHLRRGIGTALLQRALADLSTRHREARLWVLRDNHVARAFYSSQGWTASGLTRRAEFAPFPPELQLVTGLVACSG